ncbi:MAG: site-specific DNA-methyltransferase [Flavobacteriales bacterium]|nr:site-specific DNA-methyltransferase [Flavobacteriales bacterium]
MPTLHWIGKDKVINHHREVPFKVLEHGYGFSAEQGRTKEATRSGNMVVHGDNLEALKALLPRYEGRVKCIYIDPPYNTGNEGWVYNDNVNDPKIRRWLNQVVGKEGEDLSRHDKWLCMMYPRLVLLHKLLREGGIIFVSIDDSEVFNLKFLMDEVFGSSSFQHQIIWKNKYGPGALTKGIGSVHEYILCYSKGPLSSIQANLSEEEIAKYTGRDDNYNTRGGYITQPLATTSKDDRPNLVYPLVHEGEEIWPDKQWIWSRERVMEAYTNGWLQLRKTKGKWSVRFKQYLKDEQGQLRRAKPISILNGPFNQDGTAEQVAIFGKKTFDNPKPSELVKYLCSFILNDKDDRDGIYLDSFAGSGTTAHAVLNLNKQDGGNRKFILVEMEDYAETITAERVKRVMQGFGTGSKSVEGTGGAFDFYTLGPRLFDEQHNLNEAVGVERIREYVWYTETRSELGDNTGHLAPDDTSYLLGTHDGTAYYFVYEPDRRTVLDHDTLALLRTKAEHYVIYADNCILPRSFLEAHHITFKKIPRDISRF